MSLLTYGAITSLQKKINGLGMENVKDGILIVSKNKAVLDDIMRKKYIADKNIIGYIKIRKKIYKIMGKETYKRNSQRNLNVKRVRL